MYQEDAAVDQARVGRRRSLIPQPHGAFRSLLLRPTAAKGVALEASPERAVARRDESGLSR